MALLDSARDVAPDTVIHQLQEDADTAQVFESFVRAYEARAGFVRQSGYDRRNDTVQREFAEKAYLHAWRRALLPRLLPAGDLQRVRQLWHPEVALREAARQLGVSVDACLFQENRSAAARQVLALSALILNEVRSRHMYGRTPAAHPEALTRATLVEQWQAALQRGWRVERALQAMLDNPHPSALGEAATPRLDGYTYRRAEGLSLAANASVLAAADDYYPAGPCALAPRALIAPSDALYIGTLAYSLHASLLAVADYNEQAPPVFVDTAHAALALRIEVARWDEERHFPIHPGWFATLHLAYSSGQEPLDGTQLESLWRERLYRLLAQRHASSRQAGEPLPASLARELGLLPPLRLRLPGYGMRQWAEFFLADVPQHLRRADEEVARLNDALGAARRAAPGSTQRAQHIVLEEELGRAIAMHQILRRWMPPPDLSGLVVYDSDTALFARLAASMRERLAALDFPPWFALLASADDALASGNDMALSPLLSLLKREADLRDRLPPPSGPSGVPAPGALRAWMAQVHASLRAHPVLRAHAQEALRSRAQAMSTAALQEEAGAQLRAYLALPAVDRPVPQPESWLDLMPLSGATRDLQAALVPGQPIETVLHALTLDLNGMRGWHAKPGDVPAHWLIEDLLAANLSVLRHDDVPASRALASRPVYLVNERRWVEAVGSGPVLDEFDVRQGRLADAPPLRFDAARQGYTRDARSAPRDASPLRRERVIRDYTSRAFSGPLAPSACRDEAPPSAAAGQFARLFHFSGESEARLRVKVRRLFEQAYRDSPTLRRLSQAAVRRDEPWQIVVRQNRSFSVSGTRHNFLGTNQVSLGAPRDLYGQRYLSAAGRMELVYPQVVLHQIVHALTGRADLDPLEYLDKHALMLARLEQLPAHAGHTPHAQARAALRARLAQNVARGQSLAACHRGPIVYLSDLILQEAGYTFAPRLVWHIRSDRADALDTAPSWLEAAQTRSEQENTYLDRLWMEGVRPNASRPVFGVALAERASVLQRRAFDAAFADLRHRTPATAWCELPVASGALVINRAEQASGWIHALTHRSQTFAALMRAWCHNPPTRQALTLVERPASGERSVAHRFPGVDAASRTLAVQLQGYYLSEAGLRHPDFVRQLTHGLLAIIADDLRLLPRDTFDASQRLTSRDLLTLLENQVVAEVGCDATASPPRIAAAYIGLDQRAQGQLHISLARRAALWEDAYLQALAPEAT